MAQPVHVLDDYYLGITFLISLTIQSLAFLISYSLQFDKITDFSGGSNFLLLALLTLLFGQSFQSRNWIGSFSVILWSIRLAGFLLLRVLKRGKDDRFDEMRSNFFKFGGFWTFQLIWVWVVSLPITILNSPHVSFVESPATNTKFGSTGSDVVGLIFWALGFVIESLADVQKARFKSKPQSSNDLPMCQTGVWKWSRHPNYFGEILLWWGIWLMAIGSTTNPDISHKTVQVLHASVISPIFITLLLLFLSGLPTAEKPVQQSVFIKSRHSKPPKLSNCTNTNLPNNPEDDDTWSKLQEYLDSTSILFPIPQRVYKALPRWIKTTILLDWSIYRFDPNSAEARELLSKLDENPS